MAKLYSNYSFDYMRLDIGMTRDAYDAGLANNIYAGYAGRVYEDVAWFEFYSSVLYFGGTGFRTSGDTVTGGVVTGVLEEYWTGTRFVEGWGLQDVRIGAVSLFDAAMTDGRTDDFRLIASALAGADVIQMSGYADRVRGYAGNDRIAGGRGNDTLYGDGGNDVIIGGAGLDNLYGGTGADVFDYNLASESSASSTGRDVIRDFTRGTDRIDLSGIDANTAAAGNQAFTGFISASRAFSAAGQLKFSNGILYGNTDSDATAEFAVALTGVTGLAKTELVL